MTAWNADDRVFAYWEEDGYWYPATVLRVDGEQIDVRFDDDDELTLDPDYLDEFSVAVGDGVENQSAEDDAYYEAEVLEVKGDRVKVKYEDDSTEWTTLASLRIASEEEEWTVGDKVFAYWEDEGYWYPAEITDIADDGIHIRYGDDSEEVTDENYLDEFSVDVGDAVENQSAEDDLFYEAEVLEVNGERVKVKYEDDSTEWTTLASLRIEGEEEE
jgi:hypothetical protein